MFGHPHSEAPVIITGSPACEAYAHKLAYRFALHKNTGVALESQQLDAAAKQAALDEVQETVATYDKEHPETGPLHIYILDGKAAAATDEAGAATIKALVTHAMTSPDRTVAALLPEDEDLDDIAKLHPGTMLANLAKSVLATESITTLVGKAALEDYLSNGSKSGFTQETVPATEGLLLSAAMAGLMVSLVINAFRLSKGSDKVPNTKDAFALNKAIRDKYGNATWLAKQTLVEGEISGKQISHLLGLTKATSTPAALVKQTADSAFGWVTAYADSVWDYRDALVRLVPEIENFKGTQTVMLRTINAKLQALKHPLVNHPFHVQGLLKGVTIKRNWSGDNLKFTGEGVAELPALSASEIAQAAKTINDLYALAVKLEDIEEDLNQASYGLPEVDTGDDVEWEANKTEAQYQANIESAFDAKDFRKEIVWPVNDVVKKLQDYAKGLGLWIEASIQGAPAKESLEETPAGFKRATDGSLVPALEDAFVLAGGLFLAGLAAFHIHTWVKGKLDKRKAKAPSEPQGEEGQTRTMNYPNDVAQALVGLEQTVGNPEWLAKQKFIEGSVSAEGILDALAQGTKLPSNVPAAVEQHIRAVDAFQGQYVAAYNAWIAQVNPVVDKMLAIEDTDAAIKYGNTALAKIKHPGLRVTFPTAHMLGNFTVVKQLSKYFEAETIEVDAHGVPGGDKHLTIPAVTAAQAPAVGKALIDTLKVYKHLLELRPDYAKLHDSDSKQVQARGDEFWDAVIEEKPIMSVLWYHDREELFEEAHGWAIYSVAMIAKSLEKWLARSMGSGKRAAVATESFDDNGLSIATEGFGDAVKAFRRVFSSKAAHPDGLPVSPNLDVSQPKQRGFAKTYLKPAWVNVQKLQTGAISGQGILALLQVGGKLPADPLAAAHAGMTAIKGYVTGHAAATQKFLAASLELISAHANATDPAAKEAAAQKLAALPTPFKPGDTKVLEKVPGSPTVHESADDAQVHPADDAKHTGSVPALTAAQIPLYANASLAIMKEAYELSRTVSTQLKVFNQLVELSHNKSVVAKLSPAVAGRLQQLAKGKGVWVLFDYCGMLLVQASALERWCYRTVTGK